MKHLTRAAALLVSVGASGAACSTQDKVNRTLDEATKVLKNFNAAAEAIKGGFAQAPKSPGSAQSVTRGRAAAGLPAPSAQGQTATYPADVDGNGTDEQVTAFEDAATGTTFYSAEVESCDEDGACETLCLTWWEEGTTVHYVVGACGDTDEFAYCVEENGAEPVCETCDASGCGSSEPAYLEPDAGGGGDEPAYLEPDAGGGDEPPSGEALSCQGLFNCLGGCEDEACGAACEAAASQEAIDQATAYVDCLNLNSGDESACQAELDACQ